MKTKPYRAPREGNPFWPLPPDYPTLTEDGQRQARKAVCCTQKTPADFTTAWDFFRNYYLLDERDDGYFFDAFCASPPFHYQGIYDFARYPRNLLAAPRGFAKSSVFCTEVPILLAVTRPYYKMTVCLATDGMVAERFDRFKFQLGENERILQDFGSLRPKRGEGLWSGHLMRLANGAFIQGRAVGGRKRGARPHVFILDDPEYDPSHSTNTDELLADFKWMMFHIIIPMLRPGCNCFWTGTDIHPRGFLHYALYSDDPRFTWWNRRVLAAEETPEDGGETKVLWPEMWPLEALQNRRGEIGAAAYSAEYLNQPVSPKDRLFNIHPDLDTYHLEEEIVGDPLTSPVEVTYLEADRGAASIEGAIVETTSVGVPGWVRIRRPFGEFVRSMFRVSVTDYAASTEPSADFSTVFILGFEHGIPNMWLLDAWMGRVKQDRLLATIWDMGLRWNVHVTGVEAVGLQRAVVDSVGDLMDDRALAAGWRPRVVPIRYKRGQDKATRIKTALEWRLNRGRIKLPLFRRAGFPWSEIFEEIENFTLDLRFLPHDCAVDTLAMGNEVIPAPPGARAANPPGNLSALELLARGDATTAAGLPRVVDITSLDVETVEGALDALHGRAYNEPRRTLANVRVLGAERTRREGRW